MIHFIVWKYVIVPKNNIFFSSWFYRLLTLVSQNVLRVERGLCAAPPNTLRLKSFWARWVKIGFLLETSFFFTYLSYFFCLKLFYTSRWEVGMISFCTLFSCVSNCKSVGLKGSVWSPYKILHKCFCFNKNVKSNPSYFNLC